MKIAVILPTPTARFEALRFWKPRMTGADRLCFLSVAGSGTNMTGASDLHFLELDAEKGRRWEPRLRRAAGRRFVSNGLGLPAWYLSEIWPEFLWNLQSLDPDVVDVQWLRAAPQLKTQLETGPWRVIAGASDVSVVENAGAWRSYDPEQKVSIVLPVYNGEDYLRQSIDSCLAQTHRNLELVIVDDCSKDSSPSIIAEYAAHDSRIVSIRNRVNSRLPRALNAGFAATTGSFLTWTSHDNLYDPEAIERLLRYLCAWRDVDLVYTAYRNIDEDGRCGAVQELWPPWLLPVRNVVCCCFLFRRRVYEQVGNHRENMEYAEDYDYWVRAYKGGFKLMRLHEPLYSYRSHPKSMTAAASQMDNRPHSGEKVRRAHFEYRS
jgi:hypothetical protein